MTGKENPRVRVAFFHLEDPALGEQIGYDLKICSDDATLADYLTALEAFAAENLSDCLGCDGCCHERAPLTSLDIPTLALLLPDSNFPAHQVAENFTQIIHNSDGAIDITIKRKANGACAFLDETNKCCAIHQNRPFVCRSHFCIPKSPQAQGLRSVIANFGTDEFIRFLIEEEAQGASPVLPQNIDKKDYPPTALDKKICFDEVVLHQILPPELWQRLRQK